MKKLFAFSVLALWTAGILLLLPSCKLLGSNASAPGSFETNFFALSNALLPKVVFTTNTVPVYQTNQVTSYVTVTNASLFMVPSRVNDMGLPVYQTNYLTYVVTSTVPVFQTNFVATVTASTNLVSVPQLVPGTGSNTVTAVGGTVGGFWGVGGLVAAGLAGIFGSYMKMRNNALAGNADLATQTSGVLAQNIQTIMSVLTATPQGEKLLPFVKNYLVQHQAQAGVIEQVAEAVKTVDPLAAQGSAQAIIDAINRIEGPPAAPATVSAAGLQAAKPA